MTEVSSASAALLYAHGKTSVSRLERFASCPYSHFVLYGLRPAPRKEFGVTPAETAVLGDQLLTDAYAGKHIGLPALIVPPIKDKTNLFFRFKRWCERPFIRKYARLHGYSDFMSFWGIKPPQA